MDRHSITWKLTQEASEDFKKDRAQLGDDEYFRDRDRMQDFLCQYFDGDGCHDKTQGISPLGGTKDGGKLLKMRWGRPGCGKSGGLRVALVAYCAERIVVICAAFPRKDDPANAEFESAAKRASK